MSDDTASKQVDVCVVGGGPAGATAAVLLAQQGIRTCLIDHRERPRSEGPHVWMNAAAGDVLSRCGVSGGAMTIEPLRRLVFRSSEFDKSIEVALADETAFAAPLGEVEDALLDAAEAAGAELRLGHRARSAAVREEGVHLTLSDEATIRGRFAVAADGARTMLAEPLGFPERAEPASWLASWSGPVKPAKDEVGTIDVVLGLGDGDGVATVLRLAETVVIMVAGRGTARSIGEEFEVFVEAATDAKMLPGKLKPSEPVLQPSLAGAAIEMDTHVGKHGLLVGQAGGFVASLSHEGVYPGMWSGAIAAEVVVDAAESGTSQDVLAEFDSRWRTAMADYLRMPNTDLHFLLPLIFSNQQMGDRMAGAFLTGANI